MDEVKSKSESKEYKINEICVIEKIRIKKLHKQENTDIYRLVIPQCNTKWQCYYILTK
jgi:hypothetical protein